MAIGMPINIRYATDITQAKTLIINYQQNRLKDILKRLG